MKIPARFLIGDSRQAAIVLLSGFLAAFAVVARADIPLPPVPNYERIESWSAETSAERAVDLIVPLIGTHPETLEGQPETLLHVRSAGEKLVFDLTLDGFADDSVSGVSYRGTIAPADTGWQLERVSRKWHCRRASSGAKCL
ncbi:MAG: hypothetical protein AAGL24_27655 [Pseudomonadota bacterium]